MFVFVQIKFNFGLQMVCVSLAYSSSSYALGSPNEVGYMFGLTNPQVGSMDGCCT